MFVSAKTRCRDIIRLVSSCALYYVFGVKFNMHRAITFFSTAAWRKSYAFSSSDINQNKCWQQREERWSCKYIENGTFMSQGCFLIRKFRCIYNVYREKVFFFPFNDFDYKPNSSLSNSKIRSPLFFDEILMFNALLVLNQTDSNAESWLKNAWVKC